jgi:dipeptidyl aminopeptidase/acylaminoacyl peptidase
VPVTGGTTQWECLTKDNPAASSGPLFSPDGKQLAFRAQKRAGFEADKWDLQVVECEAGGDFRGRPENKTGKSTLSFGEFAWADKGKQILTLAEEEGVVNVYEVAIREPGRLPQATQVLGGLKASISTSTDGAMVAYTIAHMDRPAEVFAMPVNYGKQDYPQISRANDKIFGELDMPRPESVKVKVEGADMQMWILKPPGFDPQKKWPLAFLVHGGPQGAWEDGWSNRWNPELWAAQGYVVALPNPRGSTGFGQKFTDEISGDWGGKCYDDLMAGLAYMEKQDYIDKNRMAAAGASFGGYMMNWFEGHTTKFKTLITHCGVYNFDSMYATTDEIWFDEWEHGGKPWDKDKREAFEKFSPHRYADKFQTPMLIIHNDLDFRVPVSEGLQLFNTLQRKGIPSKLINFPDEGHWVSKPKNSEYWHKEVFAWLAKYAPPGGR